MGIRLRRSSGINDNGRILVSQTRKGIDDLNDFVFCEVKTNLLFGPPDNPHKGDRYLVGPVEFGVGIKDWATFNNSIALYDGQGWLFLEPKEGMKVLIESTKKLLEYDSINWRNVLVPVYNIDFKDIDYDIIVRESGRVFTNENAIGTITLTLPSAIPGRQYKFRVVGNNELRVAPSNNLEFMRSALTGLLGSGGDVLFADKDGATVSIICDKIGEWSIHSFFGQWKTKTP